MYDFQQFNISWLRHILIILQESKITGFQSLGQTLIARYQATHLTTDSLLQIPSCLLKILNFVIETGAKELHSFGIITPAGMLVPTIYFSCPTSLPPCLANHLPVNFKQMNMNDKVFTVDSLGIKKIIHKGGVVEERWEGRSPQQAYILAQFRWRESHFI